MTRTLTIGQFSFGSPPVTDEAGCWWTLTGDLPGWDNSGAGVRRESPERPHGHGAFSGRGFRTGRSVSFDGLVECPSRAVAAGVKARLAALLADGRDGTLTVADDDEGTLTATVGLADMPAIDWSADRGLVIVCGFELWAPDPLRYGAVVSSSTGFPVEAGGLEYDLYTDGAGADLGYLDYGVLAPGGRVSLTNAGTADAWPQFEVQGPVADEGFEIVTVGTGARLVVETPIPDGSSLVLDAATGAVLIDGTADRAGRLTWRDWAPVPAGGSVEYAFVPRGSSSAAVLTASVRPAWW